MTVPRFLVKFPKVLRFQANLFRVKCSISSKFKGPSEGSEGPSEGSEVPSEGSEGSK